MVAVSSFVQISPLSLWERVGVRAGMRRQSQVHTPTKRMLIPTIGFMMPDGNIFQPSPWSA